MLKLLASLILKMTGWSTLNLPDEKISRCVALAVPHTSNWDYLYTICFGLSLGLDFKVAIKHYWTTFPFGLIIKPLGGIGIKRGSQRDKKVSQVDMMIQLFAEHERLCLIIAPEGTRKLRKNWKAGFYHVAHNAGVPLIPVCLDYKTRQVSFGPPIDSSGTKDEVLQAITDHYSTTGGQGYRPEWHSLDQRYLK